MHEATFSAAEIVVTEGASPEAFFVVANGEAAVTVGGEERGTIAPGDWFGEIALLMGSERTATITATTDLLCYGLTPLDFRALVEGNGTIAWKVVQSMSYRTS
jgi:CRP-like cAMP-binding protein